MPVKSFPSHEPHKIKFAIKSGGDTNIQQHRLAFIA